MRYGAAAACEVNENGKQDNLLEIGLGKKVYKLKNVPSWTCGK